MHRTRSSRLVRLVQSACRVEGLDNAIVFSSPPASGLANVLRGLTSSMLLAEESGRPLFVHWADNADMAGIRHLSDLFEQPTVNSTSVGPGSVNRIHRLMGCFHRRTVLRFSERMRHELTPHHQFNSILCDMVATNIDLAIPTIFISTYYAFHVDPVSGFDFYRRRHRVYSRFRPVSDIQQRLSEFKNRHFGADTIGVHIRTKQSVRNLSSGEMDRSPNRADRPINFERHISLLDEEIDRHPHLSIFLATDNMALCKPLIERYRERVVVYPKNTTNGMVHRYTAEDHKTALIDLMLLAATRKLFGTYASTFSYEAAVAGDVPFVEIAPQGLRQAYRLVHDKTVLIDFRDNGWGSFAKEMVYDKKGGRRTSYQPADAAAKPVLEWMYGSLITMDRPVWMDIGAGTGAFCLLSKFLPGSYVHAFEPDDRQRELLASNLALNNVQDRVTVCADRMPETVDRYVENTPFRRLDFLRIHAPGSESAILNGAAGTLHRYRPNMLIAVTETTTTNMEDLHRTLISLGYRHRHLGSLHVVCEPEP